MINEDNHKRDEFEKVIKGYYYTIVEEDSSKENYLDGWLNRADRILNLYFNGVYGEMPIDAVNGRVNIGG